MDLIQKAKNLGCIIKNDEYYLWEIQKWLRDKYNIIIETPATFSMSTLNNTIYYVEIIKMDIEEFGTKMLYAENVSYKSYEEALEIGLLEALKLI